MLQVQLKKTRRENYKDNQKISNIIAITKYLSIISLYVNRLNAPSKDMWWLIELKIKTQDPYMLPTRDAFQELKTHRYSESEEMEKDISCKWKQ